MSIARINLTVIASLRTKKPNSATYIGAVFTIIVALEIDVNSRLQCQPVISIQNASPAIAAIK